MSELLVIGISHKTAPVELRERVVLAEGRAADVLRELVATDQIGEAVALSTCNRTELYMAVDDDVEAETTALGILARQAGIRPTDLIGHLYSLHNEEVARHLFRVTAGLDAMVVGEAEIQGQVKRAHELALADNTTSAIMNRLFREALTAGKKVRTETGIDKGSLSVSSVAVRLAQETLGDLVERRVVIVGAGETGELTAQALAARGVRSVFVANRHYDRAIGLSQRFGGRAVRFDDLPHQLERADIVVSSTASPHHIIEKDALAAVVAARGGKPLLLIDIAVPRDVDPAVVELEGVHLRDIDDLERVVDQNRSGRKADMHRAETMIDRELDRFTRWLATLDVVPTIAALRARGQAIADQVVAENKGKWESMSEADRERVDLLAAAIVKRLFHQPILRLKSDDTEQATYAYVQALRELFGLEIDADTAFEKADERSSKPDQTAGEVTELRPAKGRKKP